MRTSLIATTVLAAVATIAGCSRATEPTAPPAETQALVQPPHLTLTPDQSQHATCPQLWTCDEVNWFTTQAACNTACGSPTCIKDFDCHPGCLCP
jgi:hypothetical protein